MTMTHRTVKRGAVETCVDCGREPWMESFDRDCAGPHPDLVEVERDDLVGPVTLADVGINAFTVVFSLASWVLVGVIGWAVVKGVRWWIEALL